MQREENSAANNNINNNIKNAFSPAIQKAQVQAPATQENVIDKENTAPETKQLEAGWI